MHGTYRTSGKLRWARTIFTTLAVCAITALAYRIWRASAFGVLEVLTSAGTATLIAGACSSGWLIHARKLRTRAETAEWIAARQRREELLDGEEDRVLWDSVPPKTIDEDTCAYGLNVVAIKFRQAG